MDVFSPKKRSEIMSRIRSKNNKRTEIKLVKLFRKNGISGWRRHLPLPGRPDFAFRRQRVAVFIDGCFWHGCPKCYRKPKANANYWRNKIQQNKDRDRDNNRQLREMGWHVMRIWECHLQKRPQACVRKIEKRLYAI